MLCEAKKQATSEQVQGHPSVEVPGHWHPLSNSASSCLPSEVMHGGGDGVAVNRCLHISTGFLGQHPRFKILSASLDDLAEPAAVRSGSLWKLHGSSDWCES